MTGNNPLASIIVRTKDRPKLLRRALQSIAAQTYRPIEVVLVNDGGCALDVEDLRNVLADVSLNYIKLEENTGRAHAGNVGIENTKGEYVGFLDDDDELYPEHVAVLASLLGKGGFQIAYGDCEMILRSYNFETMEALDTGTYIFSSKNFSLGDLLIENYIPLIALLFRKDVFVKEKGFDETFEAYEDWDLLIRCGHAYSINHAERVTAKYIQWSRELQIAQSGEYEELLGKEYHKVIQKHCDKYTPDIIRSFRDSFHFLTDRIKDQRYSIEKKDQEIAKLADAVRERDGSIADLTVHVKELQDKITEKCQEMQFMQSGRGWRLLTRYYGIRDRLLNLLRRQVHCV